VPIGTSCFPKIEGGQWDDYTTLVDARQRNECDARMEAEETGLERVDSSAEFCCFY
jgi:hypothetical protein